MGIIYIIDSPEFWTRQGTWFKVGYTNNLAQRQTTYKTYSACPMRVIRAWNITRTPWQFKDVHLLDAILPVLVARHAQPNVVRHIAVDDGGTEFYEFPDGDVDAVRRLYEDQGFALVPVDPVPAPAASAKAAAVATERANAIAIATAFVAPALHPHQRVAVDAIVAAANGAEPGSPARGIVEYCVGSGKTNVGIAALLRLGGTALWITFRNDIVDSQLKDFRIVGADGLMVCNQARWDVERVAAFCTAANPQGRLRLVVVLRQSLKEAEGVERVKDLFSAVVVDEAHACCGENITARLVTLLSGARMRVALAMTATPFTDDPQERRTMAHLWGDGRELNRVCPRYTMFQAHADGRLAMPYAILKLTRRGIFESNNVAALAAAVAADVDAYCADFNVIVRAASIAAVDALHAALVPRCARRRVLRSHSGLAAFDACNEQRAFNAAPPGGAVVVVCDQLETGYDNPKVGMTVIAKGADDYPSHRLIQAWGRAMRNLETKDRGVLLVYTTSDCDVGYLASKIAHQYGEFEDDDLLSRLAPAHGGNGIAVLDAAGREVMVVNVIDATIAIVREYNARETQEAVERYFVEKEMRREGGLTYALAKRLCTTAIPPVRSSEEYAQRHTTICVALPDHPNLAFPKMWTTWSDFLNIDKSDSPPTKSAWSRVVRDRKITTDSSYMRAIDDGAPLPLDPGSLYGDDWTNLRNELTMAQHAA